MVIPSAKGRGKQAHRKHYGVLIVSDPPESRVEENEAAFTPEDVPP